MIGSARLRTKKLNLRVDIAFLDPSAVSTSVAMVPSATVWRFASSTHVDLAFVAVSAPSTSPLPIEISPEIPPKNSISLESDLNVGSIRSTRPGSIGS